MDLSIVIPTDRRPESVRRLLNSLASNLDGVRGEVLVIGSQGESLELPKMANCDLRYVESERSGANSKRNLGLNLARAPITLFLDENAEVEDPRFLRRHLDAHASSDATIVGGTLLPKLSGVLASSFARGLARARKQEIPTYLPAVSSGNLSVRTGAIDPWIRFDETLMDGASERELILRLESQGFATKLMPEISVNSCAHLGFAEFFRQSFLLGRLQAARAGALGDNRAYMPYSKWRIFDTLFALAFNIGVTDGLDCQRLGKVENRFVRWVVLTMRPMIERARDCKDRLVEKIPWKTRRIFVLFYWRSLLPVLRSVRRAVVAVAVFFKMVLFWRSTFPVYNFFISHAWLIPVTIVRLRGTFRRLGVRAIHRMLKPYYFVRYQLQTRFARQPELK